MQTANFDFQCDLSPVVFWQYLEATKFDALVKYQQEFMNTSVTDFVAEWGQSFLNIATAGTDGLALWGRLLNVGRPVYEKDGQTIEFTDDQYRVVLRAAIYLLVFDGSVKALNQFFKILLPNLPVLIIDNYDMSVTFNVLRDKDEVSEWEQTLLNYLFAPSCSTDRYAIALPRPSGVKYNLTYNVDYEGLFGFEGQTYVDETGETKSLQGFDNGVFYQ